jgi:HTH-type transcriptional regulator / antitoxin HigA
VAIDVKPIRSSADHRAAMAEVKRLWGAKNGTPNGDRLDVLATLIDAYEAQHEPIDHPDPIEAIRISAECCPRSQ